MDLFAATFSPPHLHLGEQAAFHSRANVGGLQPAEGVGGVNLMACLATRGVRVFAMLATVEIPVPDSLLLHSKDLASLQQRSRFLLAMKFFELGELSSGQAAEMCGLSRVAFLFEAGKLGIPVAELSDEELAAEFA